MQAEPYPDGAWPERTHAIWVYICDWCSDQHPDGHAYRRELHPRTPHQSLIEISHGMCDAALARLNAKQDAADAAAVREALG